MRSGNVRFLDGLEPLLVPITQIRPHPDNPNNGDMDELVESILGHGFYSIIIAQAGTGFIAIGNHRYAALLELGSEVAPVLFVDCDDLETIKMMLHDNRTSDLRKYDEGLRKKMLEDLAEQGALKGTGYTEHALAVMKAREEKNQELAEEAQRARPKISLPNDSSDMLVIHVEPEVRKMFYAQTSNYDNDDERFEALVMGWTD